MSTKHAFKGDKKVKSSRVMIVMILIMALMLVLAVIVLSHKPDNETVRGTLPDKVDDRMNLTIAGKDFPYRQQIKNYLFIVTSPIDADSVSSDDVLNESQAEFLLLLSIDQRKGLVRPLFIDRNTMVDLSDVSGLDQHEDKGQQWERIAMIPTFAKNKASEAMLTAQAVSHLLLDVPIDQVCTLEMEDVSEIVDYLGGLVITPLQDEPNFDPMLQAGKPIKLNGEQIIEFLKLEDVSFDRRTSAAFDQWKVVLTGFFNDSMALVQRDTELTKEYYNYIIYRMSTTLSKGDMLDFMFSFLNYRIEPMVYLEGQYRKHDSYGTSVFYPDLKRIEDLVTLWYVED